MDSFVFEFKAVPLPDCPQADRFASARVNVYVYGEAMPEAEARARAHIGDHQWEARRLIFSLCLDSRDLSQLSTLEEGLHRKAMNKGVAAKFYLRPRQGPAVEGAAAK